MIRDIVFHVGGMKVFMQLPLYTLEQRKGGKGQEENHVEEFVNSRLRVA